MQTITAIKIENKKTSPIKPATIQLDTLTGKIHTIYYSSPKFSAGTIQPANVFESPVKFSGKIFVQPGERVTFRGRYIDHPKFGYQFEVDRLEYQLDVSAEGLISYLSGDDSFRDIGPVRARKIVKEFGDKFEEFLSTEEGRLQISQTAQVNIKVIEKLSEKWLELLEVNKLMAWLSQYELTNHQCKLLVSEFGTSCVGILQKNPYLIIRKLDNVGFKRADQIALKMGFSKNDPNRISEGIMHCVLEELETGSTWTEYQELVSLANKLLIMDCLESEELIAKQIDDLIFECRLVRKSFDGLSMIGLNSYFSREAFLADIFRASYSRNIHFLDTDIEDIESLINPESGLLSKQKEAVVKALTYRMSLISGGAGTGKSYTVAEIYRICLDNELTVNLCAPTGKAAQRLNDMTGGSGAKTIHRMLGYDGNKWAYNKDDKLEIDVIMIDETSMVDIDLAYHLFSAIDMDRTMIVLIGDHNQLPPVGPGNILRDLVNSSAIPTTILTEVVRQSGDLKKNSNMILSGFVSNTSPPQSNGNCREWYLIPKYTEALQVKSAIIELYSGYLKELKFDPITDTQLITPTHKGIIGTVALNADIQRIIHGENTVNEYKHGKSDKVYVPGDKVIQTKNDYKIDIMNGTIGTIKYVDEFSGDLTIEFPTGMVTIERKSDKFNNLNLAYALTVHKCQGSEFPCVIMIVHKSHSFMHHRGIFYTGVTRAKQTVIIIGDHWGIRNCAAKVTSDNRRTWLTRLMVNINEKFE